MLGYIDFALIFLFVYKSVNFNCHKYFTQFTREMTVMNVPEIGETISCDLPSYCVSVSLCLPQLSAALQYVTCSCQLNINVMESYRLHVLFGGLHNNERFSGLGLTYI